MFKALLSFTTINLTATEIFFMVIPFSLMTPKEDAAQNVPNTQVNFLLLCYKVFLGSSILNVAGRHLPERPPISGTARGAQVAE